MGIFEKWFWEEAVEQIKCAECGKLLSEPGKVAPASSTGDRLEEITVTTSSLPIRCKKCRVLYCAGCAFEAARKIGKGRLICPMCERDLGDVSSLYDE